MDIIKSVVSYCYNYIGDKRPVAATSPQKVAEEIFASIIQRAERSEKSLVVHTYAPVDKMVSKAQPIDKEIAKQVKVLLGNAGFTDIDVAFRDSRHPGHAFIQVSLKKPVSIQTKQIDKDISQVASFMLGLNQTMSAEQENQLLLLLQNSASLKSVYSGAEGASLLEHIRFAVKTADLWKDALEAKVTPIISWNQFRLFLVLHDIAKGVCRDDELENMHDVIQRLMKSASFNEEEISLVSSLLKYDSQNLYLRKVITEDEIFDNLIEMSFDTHRSLDEVYDFLQAFNASIRGTGSESQRRLPSGQSGSLEYAVDEQQRVDSLKDRIHLAKEGEEVFLKLMDKVTHEETAKTNASEVKDLLATHGKELFWYLKVVHGKMLLEKPENDHKSDYRAIKRGFRDIILSVTDKENKKLLTYYKDGIQLLDAITKKQMSNPLHTFFDIQMPFETNESRLWFREMIDELIGFRRDYLVRYSIDKVKKIINSGGGGVDPRSTLEWFEDELYGGSSFSEMFDDIVAPLKAKIWDPTANQDLMDLLSLTFVHGSHSAILSNLPRTGMQLMPTGRLVTLGIVPFSGELDRGATAAGVNNTKLSGTALKDSGLAVEYAKRTDFHPNMKSEEELLLTFIKSYKDKLSDPKRTIFYSPQACFNTNFNRCSLAVSRLRILNPEIVEKLLPKLQEIADRLEKDFAEFKASKEYRDKMPKAKDPEGVLGYKWHDDYFYGHFLATEEGIQSLKKSLTNPAVAELDQLKERIQVSLRSVFPITFGSTTLNPQRTAAKSGETLSIKPAELGKDIQYIFVDQANIKEVKDYLTEKGLADQVKVVDHHLLTKARLLDRRASSYFRDIASYRKQHPTINR